MTMCRQQASDHSEDDGIKTITYDEYVNAGIPDALLQGLGFAESLSHEPLDMDELSNDVSVPAKETDAPSVESSSVDIQSGSLSVVASDVPQPIIPVSLIQLLSGHVGSQALSVMSGNVSLSGGISTTPTALSLVDLPVLAPVASGAASTAAGDDGKASSHAVTYVDQNGRVLRSVALPASSHSAGVRLVDSNGRIVQPSTAAVDKNGRVLGISKANADSESNAGNSRASLSSGVVTTPDMKPPEPKVMRKSVEQCNRPQSEYYDIWNLSVCVNCELNNVSICPIIIKSCLILPLSVCLGSACLFYEQVMMLFVELEPQSKVRPLVCVTLSSVKRSQSPVASAHSRLLALSCVEYVLCYHHASQ